MKVKIRNISATRWDGSDYDGTELRIKPGEVGEMSQRRAEQVLKDYPARFVLEAQVVVTVNTGSGSGHVEITADSGPAGNDLAAALSSEAPAPAHGGAVETAGDAGGPQGPRSSDEKPVNRRGRRRKG